jgi:hypothetical protein
MHASVLFLDFFDRCSSFFLSYRLLIVNTRNQTSNRCNFSRPKTPSLLEAIQASSKSRGSSEHVRTLLRAVGVARTIIVLKLLQVAKRRSNSKARSRNLKSYNVAFRDVGESILALSREECMGGIMIGEAEDSSLSG